MRRIKPIKFSRFSRKGNKKKMPRKKKVEVPEEVIKSAVEEVRLNSSRDTTGDESELNYEANPIVDGT